MIDSVDIPTPEPAPDLKKPRRKPQAPATPALLDRLPPHSVEAEQGVLACVLLSPHECMGECIEKFKAGAEVFYDLRHRTIYEVLAEMYDAKEAIDIITLQQRLRDRKQLEGVGGLEYLAPLPDRVPSAANLKYYQEIVWEKYILRQMIRTCTEVVGQIYEHEGEVDALVDEVETKILRISEEKEASKAGSVSIKDLVHTAIGKIEEYHANQGLLSGISTGFPDLDKMTTGLHGGEMIVIAARPSMGKCLAFDSEILLADGRLATLEEVHQAKRATLFTLGDDFKITPTAPSDYVDDGTKPVFRVTTSLGRVVEATFPHPFLTPDGWRKLAELKAGDFMAVPRQLPVFGTQRRRECEVKLLAYLLGDGCLTKSSPLFTNSNARVRREFAEAAAEFGGLTVQEFDSRGTRTPSLRVSADVAVLEAGRSRFALCLKRRLQERRVSARSVALAIGASPASLTAWQRGQCVPDQRHWEKLCGFLEVEGDALASAGREAISANSKNALALWLEKLGLSGADAWEKQVPPFVFTLPRSQMALFLNRLFATDGWASVQRNGTPQIGYATVSEKMARQIQHLLLRFGLIARRRRKPVRYAGGERCIFQLEITDHESQSRFVSEIGIFGKEEAVERVRHSLASRRRQTNVDLIPVGIWRRLAEVKGAESWASLARRAGIRGWSNLHVGRRALSRSRLRQLAQALDDDSLVALAESDVFWDRIVAIEPAGLKQVYDLTIPGTHNFIANDICVHNTSLAMNMAEAVAIDQKLPVGVFSLEMSAESLVLRMLCSRSKVNLRKIRDGFFSERDFPKLTGAAGKLAASPLFIDDSPGLSILQLRAKARRMWQQHGIKLFVIDYLQLLHSTARRAENRQQEIADISNGVKALAKELNVPIVVLSQLNRELEKDKSRKPRLSDLRESGAIEQDADLVALLYKPSGEDDEETQEQDGVPVKLLIAKQRNGPTGDIDLTFLKPYTRFESAAKVSDADVPET
ncbi:MAG: replicative DNA helicase [Verrucomicrobia bacterium]|nr:replicative DNA helicase [Verrucomicrobiota bacterium]